VWDGGLYGELGATYFVTSRLSLGATVTLTATYGRETRWIPLGGAEGTRLRAQQWQVSLPPLIITGAIFF
jgi:hypothetical protein